MIKARLQAKKAKADLEKLNKELTLEFRTLLEKFYTYITSDTFKIETVQEIYNFFKKNYAILSKNDKLGIAILEEYAKIYTALSEFINHHYELQIPSPIIEEDDRIFLHLYLVNINNCMIESIRYCKLNLENNLIRASYCTILNDHRYLHNFLARFYYFYLATHGWDFSVLGNINKFYFHLTHVREELISHNSLISFEENENNKHTLTLELATIIIYCRSLESLATKLFSEHTVIYNHLSPKNMKKLRDICIITDKIFFSGEKVTQEIFKKYHGNVQHFILELITAQEEYLGSRENEPDIKSSICIDKSIILQKDKIRYLINKVTILLDAGIPNIEDLKETLQECLAVLQEPDIYEELSIFSESLETLEELIGSMQKIIEQHNSFERYMKLIEKEATALSSTKTSPKETKKPPYKKENSDDPKLPPLLFSVQNLLSLEEKEKTAQDFYMEAVRYILRKNPYKNEENRDKAISLAESALLASKNKTMFAASLLLLSDIYFHSYDCKIKNTEQLNLLEQSLEYCQDAIKNYEILDRHIPEIPDFSSDALLTWAQIRKEKLLNYINLIERFIKRKEMDREAIIEQLGDRWKKGNALKPSEKTLAYRAIIALKPQLKRLKKNHLALEENLYELKLTQKRPHL